MAKMKKLTKKQKKSLRKHERLHAVMERMFPAHIANRVGFTQPRDPEANFDPAFWMDSFNSRVDANVSRAMNDMVHSEEMVLVDEQIVSDEEMERLTDEPVPPGCTSEFFTEFVPDTYLVTVASLTAMGKLDNLQRMTAGEIASLQACGHLSDFPSLVGIFKRPDYYPKR